MSEFNNDIRIQDLPDDGSNNATDFYDNFREKLNSVEKFPLMYTFKFIVKADTNVQEEVKSYLHMAAQSSPTKLRQAENTPPLPWRHSYTMPKKSLITIKRSRR